MPVPGRRVKLHASGVDCFVAVISREITDPKIEVDFAPPPPPSRPRHKVVSGCRLGFAAQPSWSPKPPSSFAAPPVGVIREQHVSEEGRCDATRNDTPANDTLRLAGMTNAGALATA